MFSLGSPRVMRAHIGHACGVPSETELAAAHALFHRSVPGPLVFPANNVWANNVVLAAASEGGGDLFRDNCFS